MKSTKSVSVNFMSNGSQYEIAMEFFISFIEGLGQVAQFKGFYLNGKPVGHACGQLAGLMQRAPDAEHGTTWAVPPVEVFPIY